MHDNRNFWAVQTYSYIITKKNGYHKGFKRQWLNQVIP
jgi:hypothetical protein